MTNNPKNKKIVDDMIKAGAHFGYTKTRRHPSTAKYILATKSNSDIINLEKTAEDLEKTKEFIKSLAKEGKKIIFVGVKAEAKKIIAEAAQGIDMPYVTERWIGGTLTNFPEIKKRIAKYLDLKEKTVKGELDKYTKKEKLLISREVEDLEKYFGGISGLTKTPDALFIIDSKKEHIAVAEAKSIGIPVITLVNTDTDVKNLDYPIIANDASSSSIKYFTNEIVGAYQI